MPAEASEQNAEAGEVVKLVCEAKEEKPDSEDKEENVKLKTVKKSKRKKVDLKKKAKEDEQKRITLVCESANTMKFDEEFDEFIDAIKFLNKVDDDAKEPYKTKYKARELLKKADSYLKAKLPGEKSEIKHHAGSEDSEVRDCYHVVKFYLGLNYIQTEEASRGDVMLTEAEKYLWKNVEKRRSFALELMVAQNALALERSHRDMADEALELLHKCETFFAEMKNLPREEFGNTWTDLEEQFTLTCFYLAQVYTAKGKAKKAAQYCFDCLSRQLIFKQCFQKDDWVKNAIGIAPFYMENCQYRQALHCVDAARAIFGEVKIDEDDEDILNINADIQRTRGEVYLSLLSASRDVLDTSSQRPKRKAKVKNQFQRFPKIDHVPDPHDFTLATDWDTAKAAFDKAKDEMENALDFYILDGFVTLHLKIKDKLGIIYDDLTFFENDNSRKCKMIKRRIDLVETVVTELNPSAFIDTIRELNWKLATGYEEIGNLKHAIMQSGGITKERMKKANRLFLKAIGYYLKFLESHTSPEDIPISRRENYVLPKDLHRQYLIGLFNLASIYQKLRPPTEEMQGDVIVESHKVYKMISKFCTEKGCPDDFKEQLIVSKEMLDLLPLKLNEIKNSRYSLVK